MFEKLLPYLHLGINFLNGLLDFVAELLRLLVNAEETISGHQTTAF